MFWHRHKWIDNGNVTFYPPQVESWEATGFITQQFVDEMRFGTSIVTQRCFCGKYRQQRHAGRVSS